MMTTAAASFDGKTLEKTWAAFDRIAHLRPIHGEAEYLRTVALMNYLLDVVGDNESHELSGLLDLVGEMVDDHDADQNPSNCPPVLQGTQSR